LNAKQAWVRALERTAAIERNPRRTLPILIEELAERLESAPALASPEGTLSYRALAGRASRYARWALTQGLVSGSVVCLLMENCPDYMAAWLGLTRAGLTVALLNTHQTGASPVGRPARARRHPWDPSRRRSPTVLRKP
jgi:fatty-acyl-CoA synthase